MLESLDQAPMDLHFLSLTHAGTRPYSNTVLSVTWHNHKLYLIASLVTLLLSSGTFGDKAVEHVAKAPTPLLTAA